MRSIDEEINMLEGCQYQETPTAARCRKICAVGSMFCPFHLLLTNLDQKSQDEFNQQVQQMVRKTYKTPRGYTE